MTVEKIKDWVFNVGCVAQYVRNTRERLPACNRSQGMNMNYGPSNDGRG